MALILEALAFVPRHHIKFFRTDAIFLQTPAAMTKKAKQALLQATRETLHRPRSWLTFNGPSLLQGTSGEGQMFRVFNCELPVQQQKSIISTSAPEPYPTFCQLSRFSVKVKLTSRSWL